MTTLLIWAITSCYTTTFTGRLALIGAFRLVNITGAAFFALGVIETGYFFGTFLAGLLASSRSSANYFWIALASLSTAFFAFSCFFLRVFAALLIFLSNLASSSIILSLSFSS
jgi:hypothetical protein